MANLYVDIHLSKSTLALFVESNCFLIASTASEYSLRQMLMTVPADVSTSKIHNAI